MNLKELSVRVQAAWHCLAGKPVIVNVDAWVDGSLHIKCGKNGDFFGLNVHRSPLPDNVSFRGRRRKFSRSIFAFRDLRKKERGVVHNDKQRNGAIIQDDGGGLSPTETQDMSQYIEVGSEEKVAMPFGGDRDAKVVEVTETEVVLELPVSAVDRATEEGGKFVTQDEAHKGVKVIRRAIEAGEKAAAPAAETASAEEAAKTEASAAGTTGEAAGSTDTGTGVIA